MSTFNALKNRSSFLRLAKFDVPLIITKEHINLTARVLIKAAEEYHEHFDGTFYVVLHPIFKLRSLPWSLGLFKKTFEKHQVKVLDFSDFEYGSEQTIGAGCDKHPNGVLNRTLAEGILKEISAR